MKEQTEAQRLADQLNAAYPNIHTGLSPAAATELRRLDADVKALRGAVEAERARNLAAASEACRAFGKAGAVLMAAIRAKVSQ